MAQSMHTRTVPSGQGFCSGRGCSQHTPRRVVCRARKVYDGKQICASEMLVCKEGHEDTVARLLADVTSYSLEQAKQRQNGIVVFESVKDQFEQNKFHIWSRYRDYAHLGKHQASPEFLKFYLEVVPHLEQPVAMALYEWKNGQLGPACMSEGPKGEGGLDDATGATGAPGGASMTLRDGFDATAGRRAQKVPEPAKSANSMEALSSGLNEAKKQVQEGLNNLFGGMFKKK